MTSGASIFSLDCKKAALHTFIIIIINYVYGYACNNSKLPFKLLRRVATIFILFGNYHIYR